MNNNLNRWNVLNWMRKLAKLKLRTTLFIIIFILLSQLILAQAFGKSALDAVKLSYPSVKQMQGNFANPVNEYKPQTWWHWIDGNVTRQGITADLESMKSVGIGGLMAFHVAQGFPYGGVDYMSKEWRDLMQFSIKEANRLGLEFVLHNCAGYSHSGGPWIKPKDSMKVLVFTKKNIESAGKNISIKLKQPRARLNFYRDICVLAFPTPASETGIDTLGFRLKNWKKKSVSVYEQHYKFLSIDKRRCPQSNIIDKKKIIDLTEKFKNGVLSWKAPEGNWTILRLGYTTSGKMIEPTSPAGRGGGRGLECDKLSKQGLEIHWRNIVQKVKDDAGKLSPETLKGILLDSYEARQQNWTDGLEKAFEKKNGYSLIDYAPILTGRVVDSIEITERVLYDFRKTMVEMFTENYFKFFKELANKNDLLVVSEPYGWGNFNELAAGKYADIPMSEFWSDKAAGSSGIVRFDIRRMKTCASAAHVYGRKFVAAESFTSWPEGRGNAGWKTSPKLLKRLQDACFSKGMTRTVFHTFAHQPWLNIWPGMTMGQWGMQSHRNNVWWTKSNGWMEYTSRAQYLLSQGRFVADICFWSGDSMPKQADAGNIPDGFDYDFIDTGVLMSIRVENGFFILPSGMKYRILALPPGRSVALFESITKIKELALAGGMVCGNLPGRSPSFVGFPESEKRFQTEIARIKKGKLVKKNLKAAIKALELKPDFEYNKKKKNQILLYLHRRTVDADIYFISNQSFEHFKADCIFRSTGKPLIWDPITGKIRPCLVYKKRDDSRTMVNLTFDNSQSFFVVFDKKSSTKQSHAQKVTFTAYKPFKIKAPKVKIISAKYGSFYNELKVDIKRKLRSLIKDGVLHVSVGKHLNKGKDPAPGALKDVSIRYRLDKKIKKINVEEGDLLSIGKQGAELKILSAIYGVSSKAREEDEVIDVTDDFKKMDFHVNSYIDFEGSPDKYIGKRKHFRIKYQINGEIRTALFREGRRIVFGEDVYTPYTPIPGAVIKDGKPGLQSVVDGRFDVTLKNGDTKQIEINALAPLQLRGPWKLSFKNKKTEPKSIVFDKLVSLTESPEESIKYFSGTINYEKEFQLTAEQVKSGSVIIDLGGVEILAQVEVNGKKVASLWCVPFRTDITKAVKIGRNKLKIKVSTLSRNRVIGDEKYPALVKYDNKGQRVRELPEWLNKGQMPEDTKRTTFATFRHLSKETPLSSSGLIGPVVIYFAAFEAL